MTPELGEAIERRLDRLTEALSPWGDDGAYFNFASAPATWRRSSTGRPASGSARSSDGGTRTA